jgi:hypothetical protein
LITDGQYRPDTGSGLMAIAGPPKQLTDPASIECRLRVEMEPPPAAFNSRRTRLRLGLLEQGPRTCRRARDRGAEVGGSNSRVRAGRARRGAPRSSRTAPFAPRPIRPARPRSSGVGQTGPPPLIPRGRTGQSAWRDPSSRGRSQLGRATPRGRARRGSGPGRRHARRSAQGPAELPSPARVAWFRLSERPEDLERSLVLRLSAEYSVCSNE